MDFQLSILVSPPLQPVPSLLSLSPEPLPENAPLSMPLPPEAIYNSKEELYASIQAWATQYYYAFCIQRSTRLNNSTRIKILYSCDCAGQPPPANHPQNLLQARKRHTTTRKTNCQFSIVAIQHTDTQWELQHRPGTEHSVHNHPPSQSASSHPTHRKLEQAETNQAKSLYSAGVKPAQAMTYLCQTTSIPLQPYDIYNLNASFQQEQKHGLSANDALIQYLKEKEVHFKINLMDENQTRHLFIAYPESIKLAETNQDVVLVDNTYKTNKFDMPLLYMIGKPLYKFYNNLYTNIFHSITSSGFTFSIGFCFLPGEKQEDFKWAFQCFQELGINPRAVIMDGDQAQKNASEEVFLYAPTLLCIWHVNQCVLAKCKNQVGEENWKAFEAAWQSVIQARTVEQFDSSWLEFKTKYSLNPETQYCVTYLQNEWLKPGQKERLVEAWTNQYLHFGIQVTSCVEGAHAYLKRYLGGKKSKGDLFTAWLWIEAAIINQITAISTCTNKEQDFAPIDIDKKLYHGCFGVVSWHALRLVQRHLETVSLP